MFVLVIWEIIPETMQLREIECSKAEYKKLKAAHGHFIGVVGEEPVLAIQGLVERSALLLNTDDESLPLVENPRRYDAIIITGQVL